MIYRLRLFAILFMFTSAWAGENRYLVRSPRALLMGDAYTSKAYDDYTLFYNPATLGRGSLVELYPINVDVGVTNALDDMDRFDNFPKDPVPIADRIMGYPIYVHAGATPGIKFGSFGFSMFANNSTSLVLRNAVYPQIDIDYRYDRGFVAGYAYSWGQGGKFEKFNPFDKNKKKTTAGRRTSVGLSVKSITREGLKGSFSLFGTTLLNEINNNSSDVGALRRALGFSKGRGWGVDFGAEHIISNGKNELAFAASVLDIGGTNFRKTEGVSPVPEQDMFMNAGVSWRQDFTLLDYSLSLDMHPLNRGLPLSRQLRMGAEIGLPLVRALAGFGEGYISYGLMVNVWVVKVMAGFYSTELGNEFKEEQGKRAVIYLSLLDFTFDI